MAQSQAAQQQLLVPSSTWSFGIDPGWKNLGAALVEQEGSKVRVVNAVSIDMSLDTIEKCQDLLRAVSIDLPPAMFNGPHPLRFASIERYVAYNNVMSSETENITQVIGMLRYGLQHWFGHLDVGLYRAIEWKTQLVKLLAKHYGFSNPSKKMELDKQFSVAAAKFVTTNPEKITNDHIADAVCLAALPILVEITSKRI